MQKLRAALFFVLFVPSSALWVGCGDTASDKPEMVVPPAPPGEAQRYSMDAYKQDHPKTMPPQKKKD